MLFFLQCGNMSLLRIMKYTLESLEEFLKDLLQSLSQRGKDIICRRYGIFLSRSGGPPVPTDSRAGEKTRSETLESIGRTYHITRERVRQLEADSLKRIATAKRADPRFAQWVKFFDYLFRERGYVIAERALFEDPLLLGSLATTQAGSATAGQAMPIGRQGNCLTFLLRLANKYIRRKEDDSFYAHWTSDLTRAESIARALREVARRLETHAPVSEEETAHMVKKQIEDSVSFSAVCTYVALSKKIAKNKWNEYGHVSSPLIRPRGMKDGAYIVLSRTQTPLHFSQIARQIQDVFANRRIHVQTVHNELIKDKRFVLVGRGLYALAEWGYEPGFVKDIICNVLKERGSCKKEAIVAEVMKRRQVKENTILMNLNNKTLFQSLPNGKYTLVA